MTHVETGPETLHVFAADLTVARLTEMAEDAEALGRALGAPVDISRVDVVDTGRLADISLASYLADGEGANPEALRGNSRLNAVTGAVLILRPRAVTDTMEVGPPLSHIGSFPLERGTPAGAPIRAASAEGSATGVPPAAPRPGTRDRRQSGVVATIALAVALLVAFVMWFIAS